MIFLVTSIKVFNIEQNVKNQYESFQNFHTWKKNYI